MRLFVAINLPKRISDRILTGTERLRALRGIRWAAPSAIHLTLKFIGEVGDERAREIAAILRAVTTRHDAFQLQLMSVGAFPSLRRPRVVWLGIEEKAELLELQLGLEEALAALGIEPEARAYRPHLTLGRAKRGGRIDAAELRSLARTTDIAGAWTVTQLDLMRSRLRPQGAEYSIVASERLAGSGTGA